MWPAARTQIFQQLAATYNVKEPWLVSNSIGAKPGDPITINVNADTPQGLRCVRQLREAQPLSLSIGLHMYDFSITEVVGPPPTAACVEINHIQPPNMQRVGFTAALLVLGVRERTG
jgi:hypothetical protein